MFDRDLFGEPVLNGHKSVLAQTFDYPPFSVLNAREGWWQERKRQWLALGIKSEVGRAGAAPAPVATQWNLPAGSALNTVSGGLTWGDSPQITRKGLNYYRDLKRSPAGAGAEVLGDD